MSILATARMYCDDCKSETLHRERKCIHCGHLFHVQSFQDAHARMYAKYGGDKTLAVLNKIRAQDAKNKRKVFLPFSRLDIYRG